MKIKLPDKISLQLGAIASGTYMMAAVCPCCGRPAMGCGVGVGGAFFVGGAALVIRSLGSGLVRRFSGYKQKQWGVDKKEGVDV